MCQSHRAEQSSYPLRDFLAVTLLKTLCCRHLTRIRHLPKVLALFKSYPSLMSPLRQLLLSSLKRHFRINVFYSCFPTTLSHHCILCLYGYGHKNQQAVWYLLITYMHVDHQCPIKL